MQIQTKKIYAVLIAGNALQTLLGGTATDKKIYPSISDKFEAFPCITYEIIASSFRTVPIRVQDISMEFHIYSKVNKQQVEDIYTELDNLLNYYRNTVQDITYIRQSYESDLNDTDRQLFHKVVRYQIWGRN